MPSGLSQAALASLIAHDWPGNVRELRNCLECAAIITNGELIQPEHLRLHVPVSSPQTAAPAAITLHFTFTPEEFCLEQVVARLKDWAMQQSGNNKSAAARLLKTTRKLFY